MTSPAPLNPEICVHHPSIGSEYLAKPRRFRVLRVLADFEVIDTHTGPASLVPGDVVLLDADTREEVPVRRRDLARAFTPLSPELARRYDAEIAAANVDWSPAVLDVALRKDCPARSCTREAGHAGPCTQQFPVPVGRPIGPTCPARRGSSPHVYDSNGLCCCGAFDREGAAA